MSDLLWHVKIDSIGGGFEGLEGCGGHHGLAQVGQLHHRLQLLVNEARHVDYCLGFSGILNTCFLEDGFEHWGGGFENETVCLQPVAILHHPIPVLPLPSDLMTSPLNGTQSTDVCLMKVRVKYKL